jgi:cell shape-determining protein MreC
VRLPFKLSPVAQRRLLKAAGVVAALMLVNLMLSWPRISKGQWIYLFSPVFDLFVGDPKDEAHYPFDSLEKAHVAQELEAALQENARLREELARSAGLASAANSTTDAFAARYVQVAARVLMSADSSPFRRSLLISTDGAVTIPDRSPVIYGRFYIGMIEHSDGKTARVRCFSDPRSHVPVRIRPPLPSRADRLAAAELTRQAIADAVARSASVDELAPLLEMLRAQLDAVPSFDTTLPEGADPLARGILDGGSWDAFQRLGISLVPRDTDIKTGDYVVTRRLAADPALDNVETDDIPEGLWVGRVAAIVDSDTFHRDVRVEPFIAPERLAEVTILVRRNGGGSSAGSSPR